MQQSILETIETFIANHGYPPTLREIGDSVGLNSTSSVSYQLSTLQNMGAISIAKTGNGRKPRSIQVLNGYRAEPASAKLTANELAQLRGLGQGQVPAVVEKILNDRLNPQ